MSISRKERFILVLVTIGFLCLEFYYSHWIAFQIALNHHDYFLYIPVLTGLFALAGVVYNARRMRHGKGKKFWIAFFVIMLIMSCIAAVNVQFGVVCPACGEVDDPFFKIFYRIFEGKEYVYTL